MPCKPDVSVIIPAHNEEALIEQCLWSVGQQLLDSSTISGEVIVLASACTDTTQTVANDTLSAMSDLPSRVIEVRARGKKIALNCGLIAANSEAVLCIDADSTVRNGAIELALNNLDKEGVHLSGGQFRPETEGASTYPNCVSVIYEELRAAKRRITQPHKTAIGRFMMFHPADIPDMFPEGPAADDLWLSADMGRRFGLDGTNIAPDIVVEYSPAQSIPDLYAQLLRYQIARNIILAYHPETSTFFNELDDHNAHVDGSNLHERWRNAAHDNGVDFDTWITPFQWLLEIVAIEADVKVSMGQVPTEDHWDPALTTKARKLTTDDSTLQMFHDSLSKL